MKGKPSRARVATPEGLDAVYGVHAVRALFERGQPPRELWIQEGRAEARLEALVALARQAGVKCAGVARETLDGVARGAVHQGVIAFAPPLQAESEEALWFRLGAWQQSSPPLLLILDGVTDPHNFGACLRSADAAGAQYADLAGACLAALYPAVVAQFAAKHGAPPGRGAMVLGMGSLGAERLNASSDLDLIVIYDAAGVEASEGRRPLAARA